MATCSGCSTSVTTVTAWIYPNGNTLVIQNHGTSTVPVCPGSLKPV